jgi:hypothetical protein
VAIIVDILGLMDAGLAPLLPEFDTDFAASQVAIKKSCGTPRRTAGRRHLWLGGAARWAPLPLNEEGAREGYEGSEGSNRRGIQTGTMQLRAESKTRR